MRQLETTELLETAKKCDYFSYDKYSMIDWHGTSVYVKHMIKAKDVASLVNTIMKSMIDKDGVQRSELFDFIVKVSIINSYSYIDMPDDIESQYQIIYGTDLFNCIINKICIEQLYSIEKSLSIYLGINIKII